MKIYALVLLAAIPSGSLIARAQTPGTPSPTSSSAPPPSKPVTTGVHAVPADPGEKKFQQNCSRCHNAPEQLPPRITGTVLQHMRVRASLSAEDERMIIRYLAP